MDAESELRPISFELLKPEFSPLVEFAVNFAIRGERPRLEPEILCETQQRRTPFDFRHSVAS